MSRCGSKTNAAKKCVTKRYDHHQPFPQTGLLADNMNQRLNPLREKDGQSQAIVYCYVIATIENQDGHFVQKGSGPNFQGDLITLCTCKHRMRTSMGVSAWKGKWVAGFTGVEAGGRKNFLVYLMQVSHAFKSHHAFWLAKGIPIETKQVKAAHSNKFGDIYMPRPEAKDPFDPQDYVRPCDDHVHAPDNCWHIDINYKKGYSKRPAALLVGDEKHSSLWNKPMIFYTPPNLPRGPKKFELADLFKRLKTGP